jgi:hypothetical protein
MAAIDEVKVGRAEHPLHHHVQDIAFGHLAQKPAKHFALFTWGSVFCGVLLIMNWVIFYEQGPR